MTSNWAVSSSEVFLRMIGAVVEISEVKWKSICCVQLCDLCTPPGSSIHGVLQAKILEWAAISISRESSQPRYRTRSPALQTDSLPCEPPGNLVGATPFQIVPYGGGIGLWENRGPEMCVGNEVASLLSWEEFPVSLSGEWPEAQVFPA